VCVALNNTHTEDPLLYMTALFAPSYVVEYAAMAVAVRSCSVLPVLCAAYAHVERQQDMPVGRDGLLAQPHVFGLVGAMHDAVGAFRCQVVKGDCLAYA
jgi:hypothetical protein